MEAGKAQEPQGALLRTYSHARPQRQRRLEPCRRRFPCVGMVCALPRLLEPRCCPRVPGLPKMVCYGVGVGIVQCRERLPNTTVKRPPSDEGNPGIQRLPYQRVREGYRPALRRRLQQMGGDGYVRHAQHRLLVALAHPCPQRHGYISPNDCRDLKQGGCLRTESRHARIHYLPQ